MIVLAVLSSLMAAFVGRLVDLLTLPWEGTPQDPLLTLCEELPGSGVQIGGTRAGGPGRQVLQEAS